MAITGYKDTDFNPLFKKIYGELGDQLYWTGYVDPLLAKIKKTFKLKGDEFTDTLKIGFGGSVGSGVLPTANRGKYVRRTFSPYNVYARLNLDRKTMVVSKGSEAAFKQATEAETMGKVQSFNRNMARIAYGGAVNGALGHFSGNASGSATAPVITILNTGTIGWKDSNWEEGDYVNVNSLASVWEIDSISESNRQITLKRISGSDDLTAIGAGTHVVYMQNSKDNDPPGLGTVRAFTSGSLYGVDYQRRYSPLLEAAGSKTISADLLNKVVLTHTRRSGEAPDLIVFSTRQMIRLLNAQEDFKRYLGGQGEVVGSSNSKSKASVSFSAISYQSPKGVIPIVESRFLEDDMVLVINTTFQEAMHSEAFGWFNEDNTILLRDANSDSYEARYGGYMTYAWNPLHISFITGLAV